MTTRRAIRVYLEVGSKRTFACALDWPGWCRSGRGEEQAIAAFADYLSRYAPVAAHAGLALAPDAADTIDVVERLPGTAGYTDFGAPGEFASTDRERLSAGEAKRLGALVAAAWTVLDGIVAVTPAGLRKGPRGGGRDRDVMVAHVLGAESAYARKLGVKHRQPANDDTAAIASMRTDILASIARPSNGDAPVERGWPPRYAARRIAWHALDHAWEMQDRAVPAGP